MACVYRQHDSTLRSSLELSSDSRDMSEAEVQDRDCDLFPWAKDHTSKIRSHAKVKVRTTRNVLKTSARCKTETTSKKTTDSTGQQLIQGMMTCSLTWNSTTEKCLDVVPNVVLCAEEGGLTVLSPATSECCSFNIVPTTSVIAGGRGRSLPARLAVGFQCDFCLCCRDSSSAPTTHRWEPPRLLRQFTLKRHQRCYSFRFRHRNQVLDLSRRLSLLAETLSASQRGSPFLGFWTSEFTLFEPGPEATALQYRCVGSSQGVFSGRSPCTHCCRSAL